MGEPLRFRQDQIALKGAAIECRLNAEDPQRNFMPQPGKLSALRWPGGPGVRVDSHVYAGYTIPPFYDSLLAKLIVWDEDRASAIRRMQRALAETHIEGVHSTVALHQELLADPSVQSGQFHTGYLEQWMAQRAAAKSQA
jgi:acetyl-CoA carboxylase biotin carboxylase subunit